MTLLRAGHASAMATIRTPRPTGAAPVARRWRLAGAGLASVAVVAVAAARPLAFRGVAVDGGRAYFALADADAGVADWVPSGGRFAGYRVGAYDAAARTLTLAREGEAVRLVLTRGTATDAAPPPAVQAAVCGNLRRLREAACLAFVEQARASVRAADLIGPDRYLNRIEPAAGEDYSRLEFRRGDRTCAVVTAAGAVIALPADSVVRITRPPGETLASVSRAGGWPLERLCALNPGIDPQAAFSRFQPVRVE